MLTVRDVSERLRCSPATVRKLIHDGQLDAFRLTTVGGRWRVTPEALEQYQRQRAVVPAQPATAGAA